MKIVLVQLAVPSRQDVEEYQNLRSTVNELVGRINGRFGTVEFMPIHFMHKSLPFDELCALYALSDVCLISSTRDGMNLVSYEYIACQQKRHGAMILSEFAGAAQSLNGSIVVNPWDPQQVADAIYEAVTMDAETRAENQRKLFKVSAYCLCWRFVLMIPSIWETVHQQILRILLGKLFRRRDDEDKSGTGRKTRSSCARGGAES